MRCTLMRCAPSEVWRAADRYAYILAEALLIPLYLPKEEDVYMHNRHLATGACPAEPSATLTQLDLYELASRNRNTACSQHEVHAYETHISEVHA